MEIIMRTITSEEGKTQLIMQKQGDFTLIAKYKKNGTFHEFVVCRSYDENKGVWSSGHYFGHNLAKAIEFLEKSSQEYYISKDRLCEIATQSLHLLKENELLEDLHEDVKFEPNELEFFGLSEVDEIYIKEF